LLTIKDSYRRMKIPMCGSRFRAVTAGRCIEPEPFDLKSTDEIVLLCEIEFEI